MKNFYKSKRCYLKDFFFKILCAEPLEHFAETFAGLGVFGKIFQSRVDNFIKRLLVTDERKKIFSREKKF